MAHTYALGAVKPWVRAAAQEVGDKFDISTIYGVGARAEVSDHPRGLATDFMVYQDKAKGDAVYAYVKQNWNRLAVKYIIWYQRIDEGGGFTPMEDRGGVTANHMDHVHVSYTDTGGSSGTNTGGDTGGSTAAGGTDAIGQAIGRLNDANTWIRAGELLAGMALLWIVFYNVIKHSMGGIS
jgi:hypothetical protein